MGLIDVSNLTLITQWRLVSFVPVEQAIGKGAIIKEELNFLLPEVY